MKYLTAILLMLPMLALAQEYQIEASGSVVLEWTPPTENVDGTELTDLDGYVIYWGRESGNYTDSLPVDDAGRTSATVQLEASQATTDYYFAMTAVDDDGNESAHSNEVVRTLQIDVTDDTPPAAPDISSEIEFTVDGCVVVGDPSAECAVTFE